MDIKKIRVDEINGGISYYSTNYYHVEYSEDLKADELVVTSTNKAISQVKAISLVGALIVYMEIYKH
jgi:hypothetical protein